MNGTGIDDTGKPVERDIGTEQCHHLTRRIAHRHEISAKHHLGAILVVVGVAPVSFLRTDAFFPPVGLEIVVVGTAQLNFLQRAVLVPGHIGLVPMSLLGIIVGSKNEGCAYDGIVLLNQPARDGKKRIGLIKTLAGKPQQIISGSLNGSHHLLDFQTLHLQLRFGILPHGFENLLAGIIILYGGSKLNKNGSNHNKCDVRPHMPGLPF